MANLNLDDGFFHFFPKWKGRYYFFHNEKTPGFYHSYYHPCKKHANPDSIPFGQFHIKFINFKCINSNSILIDSFLTYYWYFLP